jgi:organic hydroperoxide reductase OsmC/OhrA
MVELVWDDRTVGTATTPRGRSILVGDAAEFSPDELLATAAASCLMRTLVRLADGAGIKLLGFTAGADVNGDCQRGDVPSVHLWVHLVVSDAVPAPRIAALWTRAVRQSPLARLLGGRLVIEHDITHLAEDGSPT